MEPPAAHPRIRPAAAEDLEQAVQFLDLHSATAADEFLEAFYHAAQLLAEMPRLGRVRRTRGRLKWLRSWPLSEFGPYIVFYLPVDTGIEVIRVLHGARDIDRELRN